MIPCRECGTEFNQIQWMHLKKHGMTLDEYREKYPDAPITSEETKQKISENHADFSGENHPAYGMNRPEASERMKENNPMDDPEIREKAKQTQFKKNDPRLIGENNPMKDPEISRKISKYKKRWWEKNKGGLRGENNPNWKGEKAKTFRGKNWKSQRGKALKRDDWTCQVCGITEEKSGRELDVHHKIPLLEFDNYEKANKLENLITLCRSCHIKIEMLQFHNETDYEGAFRRIENER